MKLQAKKIAIPWEQGFGVRRATGGMMLKAISSLGDFQEKESGPGHCHRMQAIKLFN